MTTLRLQNLRRAIVSFGWVVLAYIVYAICVVPWIEPRRHRDSAATGSTSALDERSTDRYVRELRPLFPAGSWELDDPKVLRSPQATVLLRHYDVLPDGSLKIEPCTVVFYGADHAASGDSPGGPTIMQAPGAILAFDRPLDLQRVDIGKPVHGRLLGEIRIFRAGRPGSSDDLEIVTSNVEINQRRILTPDEVRFRIGESYGKGRDLMLTLAESSTGNPTDHPWLGGLELIELQELDALTLQVTGGDLFDSLNTEQNESAPGPQAPTTSTVTLHCDGPMRFDLRHLIAVVEQNVRMSRQQVGKPKDTLRAERLTMHLALADGTTESDGENPSDRPSPPPDIAITRIVATGDPLVINAPSMNAYVESQRLDYDVKTGQIKLKGWNPFAAPPIDKTGEVIFRNQQHAMVAPSIDFSGGEDMADRAAWRISAEGPGTYRGLPTNDPQVLIEARWQKGLSVQPRQGQQVLQLQGAVDVRASKFGSVEAETIELWLRHESQAAGPGGAEQTKPVPRRLVAKAAAGRSVQIESAQLTGSLQEMTVVFTSQANAAAAAPADAPGNGRVAEDIARDGPRKSRSRFRIHGEKLDAWVDLDRQEMQRLKMEGPSRLTELVAADELRDPVDIIGQAIDYQTDAQGRPVALIQGTPAVFQASGMALRGADIHLSGSENRVWVPGPGSMRLPVPRQLLDRATVDRPPARPAETIEVTWEEDLNFDGQTALFQGRVAATGPSVDFRSALLRVTLDRPIDLADLSDPQGEPEIKEVYADGGIFVTARSRNALGAIKSIQQMSAPNLRLNYSTGKISTDGAGWISMTSRGRGLPLSPGPPVPARDPATSDADDRLTHLSVAFRQQLEGNLWQREAHLYDNIHGWFGPVDTWQKRVDPLQQQVLGPDDVLLTCHELFVLESPTAVASEDARRPLELLARGDTYVQSQQYAARGHRIKYAEEKDMLTLEGDQYRPAELWLRSPHGGPPSSDGQFRMIRYWPKTQQIEVNGGLGADLSNLPTISR